MVLKILERKEESMEAVLASYLSYAPRSPVPVTVANKKVAIITSHCFIVKLNDREFEAKNKSEKTNERRREMEKKLSDKNQRVQKAMHLAGKEVLLYEDFYMTELRELSKGFGNVLSVIPFHSAVRVCTAQWELPYYLTRSGLVQAKS